MSTAEHLKSIDGRLDRLDAKVDARFVEVDKRFDRVDRRLDDVDGRLDGQRSEFRALFEASRSDFNNLYDFVKAQAERTEARFGQLQTEMRTGFADVRSAITALVPRGRRAGGRRRR